MQPDYCSSVKVKLGWDISSMLGSLADMSPWTYSEMHVAVKDLNEHCCQRQMGGCSPLQPGAHSSCCSMLDAWQTLYLINSMMRSSAVLQAAAAQCTGTPQAGAPQAGASTTLQHEVQTLRAQLQQALRDQSR